MKRSSGPVLFLRSFRFSVEEPSSAASCPSEISFQGGLGEDQKMTVATVSTRLAGKRLLSAQVPSHSLLQTRGRMLRRNLPNFVPEL